MIFNAQVLLHSEMNIILIQQSNILIKQVIKIWRTLRFLDVVIYVR